jgi:phage shock protein E
MLGFLKNLFKSAPKADFAALLAGGAQIVDVRTPGEYAGGHIPGSINVPLNTLGANMDKIRKDKPAVLCCASGMRSAIACKQLKAAGYTEVYNGGSWVSVRRYQ